MWRQITEVHLFNDFTVFYSVITWMCYQPKHVNTHTHTQIAAITPLRFHVTRRQKKESQLSYWEDVRTVVRYWLILQTRPSVVVFFKKGQSCLITRKIAKRSVFSSYQDHHGLAHVKCFNGLKLHLQCHQSQWLVWSGKIGLKSCK